MVRQAHHGVETLDLAIRTLWQEFFEASLKRHSLEIQLKGEETFTRKKIKGKDYWYKQHYHQGKAIQEYFGAETNAMLKQIADARANRTGRVKAVRGMRATEERRGSLLRRAGLPSLDSMTVSIIEKLSEFHLFEKGILIGSYAFAAYSGLLGRLFEGASLKTMDIDLVPETFLNADPIEILTPEGFLPVRGKNFYAVPGLSNKALPFSFVGPDGFRIDFLAPMRGKPKGVVPVKGISRLGAQTLPFLDFLVKNPVHGVLIGPKGGIAVTVPEPARFAIHKLIVAQRRPITAAAKRAKDLLQAAQLIEACSEESPHELKNAYREAVSRGKQWKSAIEKSLKRLPQEIKKRLPL